MNISSLFRNIALAAAAGMLIFSVAGLIEKSPLVRGLIPDRAVVLKYSMRDRLLVDIMPASALLVSQNKELAPDPFEGGKLLLFQVVAAALCFYIAAVLGNSVFTGALAAALAVFFAPADAEQALFACLILVAIGWGVRRSGRETRANAAWTGLLLGTCFLVRSSGISFPFVWAAHEIIFTRGRFRERLWRALILFFAALAVLLPWAALNYKVLGVPALFESSRAYCNLVTGVLGSVFTIEGNYRGMAGLQPGQNVYAWAMDMIMRNPLGYAWSVLRRLCHIVLLEPVLVAAAAAGVVFFRERKKAVLLLLLASGFALSHALMSIEHRYFQPLWLILCCVAVLPAARLPWKREWPSFTNRIFITASAAALCLLIFTEAMVVRSIIWLRDPEPVLAAAEKDRGTNPYLLHYAARTAYHSGDHPRLLYFTRAAAAAGLQGAAAALGALTSQGIFPKLTGRWLEPNDQFIIKALRQLELGDENGARVTLELAQARNNGQVRGLDYGVDAAVAEKVKSANDFRHGAILEALIYWPPEKRPLLLKRLERIMPLSTQETLRKALFLLAEDNLPMALKTVESLHGRFDDNAQNYQAVGIYAACGAGQKAAALFDASVSSWPIKSGVKEYLLAALVSGRLAAALDRLARAQEGTVYSKAARKMASEPAWAKCETLRITTSRAGGRGFIATASAAELRAGFKDEAAASAECGLGISTDDGEKALLALILQDSGRPAEAARRLDDLAASDSRYLYDSGVAYLLACDLSSAETRLRNFLKKFPGDVKAESALQALGGYARTTCAGRSGQGQAGNN